VRIACVHGLGGTALTMAPLATALGARGHDVATATLPGHGTRPEDLLDVTWETWLAAVPAADVLVGQSMGANLSLAAAAQRPEVGAVVAINPLAPDPDAVEGLRWRMERGATWTDAPPADPGEAAYDRLPLGALLEMTDGVLATDLAAITQPVVLVTSLRDDVVDPAAGTIVARALRGPVEHVHLPGSGHVATLGPELDLIVGAVDRLLARLSRGSSPRR